MQYFGVVISLLLFSESGIKDMYDRTGRHDFRSDLLMVVT